ncbi:MAG: PEP-CTERM sorting domain-containing protein [Planctomycetota bacterium]
MHRKPLHLTGSVVFVTMILCLATATSVVQAETFYWENSAGGLFTNPTNWREGNQPATVPPGGAGADHQVEFYLPVVSPYTVQMPTSPWTIDRIRANHSKVVLDFTGSGGAAFDIEGGVNIGHLDHADMTMEFRGGTMNLGTTSPWGILTVGDGLTGTTGYRNATFDNMTVTAERVRIGPRGHGNLNLRGGTRLTSRNAIGVGEGEQNGQTGYLVVRDAGTVLSSTASGGVGFDVGGQNHGQVTVQGGAGVDLSDTNVRLGDWTDSSGILNITGTDTSDNPSWLTAESILVGVGGWGSLGVAHGARVHFTEAMSMASRVDTTSYLNVSHSGSILTVDKDVNLGGKGRNNIMIDSGGLFEVGGLLNVWAAQQGTEFVVDGGKLKVGSQLNFYEPGGILNVTFENGAVVDSALTDTSYGNGASTGGTLTLRDEGTLWTNHQGNFYLGGVFTLEGGADLVNYSQMTSSGAQLTLRGAGTTLTNHTGLTDYAQGDDTLRVLDGAVLSSRDGNYLNNALKVIDGSDSAWRVEDGWLAVGLGSWADTTLEVTGGAALEVTGNSTLVGTTTTTHAPSGTLFVGAGTPWSSTPSPYGTTLKVVGSRVEVEEALMIGGFIGWNPSDNTPRRGTAHGLVLVGPGSTVEVDDTLLLLSDQATLQMDGGTVKVGALVLPAVPGWVNVGFGGVVGGVGTIEGNVINLGGYVTPGLSPGTLTIEGDYVNQDGELVMEIAGYGPGQYDKLIVTGQFTPGGTLRIVFADGFFPNLSSSYTLFDVGSMGPGQWDAVLFDNVPDGPATFSLTNQGGSVTLDVAVPEPMTLVALLSGVVGLGNYLRHRRREG